MDSSKKILTHDFLIEFVRAFAADIPNKGVCNGVTSMWIQAVITGQEEESNFYKRLDSLSKYLSNPNYNLESLKKEIDDIAETQKNLSGDPSFERKELTPEELDKIELRAFAESIALQQWTNELKIFEKFIFQNDKSKLYPFTASAKNHPASQVKSDVVGTVGLTKIELEKYFNDIKEVLEKESKYNGEQNGAFLLGSDNHAIGLYLDFISGKWHFFDINQLNKEKKYYFSLDSSQLASHVFDSFFDNKDENTVFTTHYISTNHKQGLIDSLHEISHKLLFSSMEKVNIRKNSALFLAALQGDVSTINKLIEANANLNVVNKDGWTLLMLAAYSGRIDTVKALLLNANANINATNENGSTALMLAAQNGQLDVIEALISADPKPNIMAFNKYGWNALMMASQEGYTEVVKVLLSAAPKNNKARRDNSLALLIASKKGHTDTVKALLDASPKPNINAINNEGSTALMLAAQNGHINTVIALLNAIPKPNIDEVNDEGATALMLASELGHSETVKALLNADPKANVNDENNEGWNALMMAVYYKHIATAKALLDGVPKPNMDALNNNNFTALMIAIDNDDVDMVNILLIASAKPNLAVFEFAREQGNESIIKILQNARDQAVLPSPQTVFVPAAKSLSDYIADSENPDDTKNPIKKPSQKT